MVYTSVIPVFLGELEIGEFPEACSLTIHTVLNSKTETTVSNMVEVKDRPPTHITCHTYTDIGT